jgi:hypothetical protein
MAKKTNMAQITDIKEETIMKMEMTREEAIEMVMDMGDNRYGAEEIVDTMIEQGIALTEESIRQVTEDTWDR